VYITNRTATLSSGLTPIELLSTDQGQASKPDLSHMRIIGCNAHYHIHKEKRARSAKFGNRARTGILVGYDGSTIYRIYDPTNGVIRSSAVVFEEDTTLTEAAVVEISDPESETDPLGVFETPKREESVRNGYNKRQSDRQPLETVTPVIQDTELEPLEGGTIVVDKKRPIPDIVLKRGLLMILYIKRGLFMIFELKRGPFMILADNENSIFINKELNIIISLYVDDLAIIGLNLDTIKSFIKELKTYFKF
jgi:hypothetical protein